MLLHSDYAVASAVCVFATTRILSCSLLMLSHLPKSLFSSLPSEQIYLSPFTKDFRGGGHLMSLT